MFNYELNEGVVVDFLNKKGDLVKYIIVNGCNICSFKVSFLIKNILVGKYDVMVVMIWGN